MKKIKMKNREGLTLVELLVSLAIVSIIVVSLLNMFGTGLFNIVRAGNRTVNTETATNNFITNPVPVSDEIILTIDFGGDAGEDTVEVKGRMGKGSGTLPGKYGNIEVDIESFVPGLDDPAGE